MEGGERTASFVGVEYPYVGGVMFSSNVGNYVPDYTVSSQNNVSRIFVITAVSNPQL